MDLGVRGEMVRILAQSIWIFLIFSISAWADENTPGGAMTTSSRDQSSFQRPAPGISKQIMSEFLQGRRLFHSTWSRPDDSHKELRGLGPLFNAEGCGTCHLRDGRGRPTLEVVIKKEGFEGFEAHSSLVVLLKRENGDPDPVYGFQFQPKGQGSFKSENFLGEGRVLISYQERTVQYPDNSVKKLRTPAYHLIELNYGPLEKDVILSPRLAPAVFGLGLLEAISPTEIRAQEDRQDENGDGITGKAAQSYDWTMRQYKLGRFGWRASQPDLRHQNAGAAVNDMSLMNRIFTFETITKSQSADRELPTAGSQENPYELKDDQLSRLTLYTHLLGVPKQDRDHSSFEKGRELFRSINCVACHRESWTTDVRYDGLEILSDQNIQPYTDLLLHDMGEGLADRNLKDEVKDSLWRTPPLWGLGLHEKVNENAFYLHDGRARDLEEAILWHGGEAKESQQRFTQLSKEDRKILLQFLKSL